MTQTEGWQKPTCLGVVEMEPGETVEETIGRIEMEYLIRELGFDRAAEVALRELTYEPVGEEA